MFNVMYSRYILTISALIIILMMDVLYFSKPKINNKSKHKMYSYLIITNTIILSVEIVIMFFFGLDLPFNTCIWALKARDLFLMLYFVTILFYYYTAVNDLQYKNLIGFLKNEKIVHPHLVFTLIVIIVHIFLPYTPVTKETYNAAFGGPAFYLTIMYCVITTLETIYIVIFKSKNKINYSERLSLIILFSLMMVILIFQTLFYDIAIMGLVSSVYVLLLYFVFENPDLELVEEISSLTKEVEQANRTKLDFLSNVSREMITPINAIAVLSESVLTDNIDDEKKLYDDIKQIELSSKNFLEIVDNALDISNAESENEELYENNYSLATLLDGLTNIANEKIGNKNVKFILNADNTIPNNLYGDFNKVHQILLNIVSNAVKYTEVGRITMTVSKEIKNSTIVLKFKIADTGIGIKSENFGKIFEKYSRLEDAVSRGIEGTGLGLTIAKRYVYLLGGQIVVDSQYGAGTTFYIDIPQQIVETTNTLGSIMAAQKEIDEEEPNKKLDCASYRILIVEDNPLDLEVTKRLFSQYKFNIDSCSNGKDCIFKYKKGEHYDMILLDHVMPEMSGIEVMQVIRKLKDYEVPPLVALTANTFKGSKDMYLSEGFDEYLPKPIDLIELDALVNKYFKK